MSLSVKTLSSTCALNVANACSISVERREISLSNSRSHW